MGSAVVSAGPKLPVLSKLLPFDFIIAPTSRLRAAGWVMAYNIVKVKVGPTVSIIMALGLLSTVATAALCQLLCLLGCGQRQEHICTQAQAKSLSQKKIIPAIPLSTLVTSLPLLT